MKKLFFLFLLFPLLCLAQNHIDLFRISYGETFKNNFKDSLNSTHIYSFDTEMTVPVRLNEKHAIISGIDYSRNNLQLFPDAEFVRLQNTTLKLGLASQWNEKWSSAIVLLPKLTSDYKELSAKDFYAGLFATAKMKKTENFSWRFGVYASTEAYGVFATPVLGWVYQSPGKRFEMNMSLPVNGYLDYKFGTVSIGADYSGIARSFRLHPDNSPAIYADLSSLRFSTYLQLRSFKESLLLRAKFGYSSDKYEVYPAGEKMGLKLSALKFGDHRTRLNPEIQGSPFFKIEAVYRFHTVPKK